MIVSKSHFDRIYGFEMSTFKLYQYMFHLNFKELNGVLLSSEFQFHFYPFTVM